VQFPRVFHGPVAEILFIDGTIEVEVCLVTDYDYRCFILFKKAQHSVSECCSLTQDTVL
jgi:hypothetical protein